MKKINYQKTQKPALIISILLIFVCAMMLGQKTGVLINKKDIMYDNTRFVNIDGLMQYQDSNYESLTGIDVSSFQGTVDYKKVKDFGIDFVIVRCGLRDALTGELYIDDKYDENMQNALDNNLDVGIYFYSSATTLEELEEEINLTLSLASKYNVTYPIAYDMEPYKKGDRVSTISVEDKTLFAKTFCQKMEEHGYSSMIYGNRGWLLDSLDFNQIKNYHIWYAAYLSQPEFEYPYQIWQYSSDAKVPGVPGRCDINIYVKKK